MSVQDNRWKLSRLPYVVKANNREWRLRLNQPPHCPQGFPSSAVQYLPPLVLPYHRQDLLCLELDLVLSQCVFSAASVGCVAVSTRPVWARMALGGILAIDRQLLHFSIAIYMPSQVPKRAAFCVALVWRHDTDFGRHWLWLY